MRASDVGGRIRQIRQQLKLTQAQFAQRLGVTKVSVARYEAGRIPRMRVLEEIAKLGGVAMSSLLEAQDRPPRVGSPEDRFYKVAADFVGFLQHKAPIVARLPKAYQRRYEERVHELLTRTRRELEEYQRLLEADLRTTKRKPGRPSASNLGPAD